MLRIVSVHVSLICTGSSYLNETNFWEAGFFHTGSDFCGDSPTSPRDRETYLVQGASRTRLRTPGIRYDTHTTGIEQDSPRGLPSLLLNKVGSDPARFLASCPEYTAQDPVQSRHLQSRRGCTSLEGVILQHRTGEGAEEAAKRNSDKRSGVGREEGAQIYLPAPVQHSGSPYSESCWQVTEEWWRMRRAEVEREETPATQQKHALLPPNALSLFFFDCAREGTTCPCVTKRAAGESDQGRYTCLANNSVGEDRTDTELLVRPNASVVVLPEEARVELGRAVTFNCSARGFRGAVASTWWVHDGAPLKANPPRVALRSDDQRLHIASVLREDAGIYQCFVRYGDATAQASAQLRLREVHSKRSVQNRVSRRWNGQNSYLKSRKETPPELKAVFTRKLVDPGERFSLRCVASGNPLPRVTWALDGGMVGESHRVHYGDFVSSAGDVISYVNVTSATRDDGGLYRCEASNDLGTAWHDDRIDVRGPPRVRPMANLTVTSGTTLVYHCPYTGHPAPKVTWSRGGRDLPHNERQRAFENGTIVITDVTREADEGVYTCRATTPKQEDSKDLNVKIIKKTVLNPFNFPKTLAEGMQVVITCSVRSGDTPIKIWWLKDGVPFSKTQLNIQEASLGDLGSNLVFNEVGRAHNGRYTCVAENDGGITNHTAELVVFVPPKWKIEPSDKSSIVRSRVTFDCQAEGHPPPLIRWKIALGDDAGKAFKSIISNYHMQMFENGSLIINDVEPKDAGQYLCEATNGIGVGLSTVVRLSVHGESVAPMAANILALE
ncbi:hypothetical protein HPB49_006296 [Dermacentor silvarum]|uniref:Uncharacterized protein n=1 Tax=Dermacentor silvarum TaxID=543639 RepID=A0ACB8CVD7_DERSI|nr:hypothetical protein HPB49_006296 [Dermacentor silvarum]